MEEKGLTERVTRDVVLSFRFLECDVLPPPVLQFNHVSFSYSGKKEDEIYHGILQFQNSSN